MTSPLAAVFSTCRSRRYGVEQDRVSITVDAARRRLDDTKVALAKSVLVSYAIRYDTPALATVAVKETKELTKADVTKYVREAAEVLGVEEVFEETTVASTSAATADEAPPAWLALVTRAPTPESNSSPNAASSDSLALIVVLALVLLAGVGIGAVVARKFGRRGGKRFGGVELGHVVDGEGHVVAVAAAAVVDESGYGRVNENLQKARPVMEPESSVLSTEVLARDARDAYASGTLSV